MKSKNRFFFEENYEKAICYLMIHLFNEHSNTLDVIRINQHSLIFSSLKEYHQPAKSEGFAIKYVVEGVERYKLNGKNYPITTGKYLLTNDTYEGNVEIESNRNVKGICININPQLITEVLASTKRADTAFTDNELGKYFTSVHFLDNQYTDTQTHLGVLLRNLTNQVYNNEISKEEISTEFFYTIAEKIIQDQAPVFKQLHAIPGLKPATKKDLYRRLQRGKEFIDIFLQAHYPSMLLPEKPICQSIIFSDFLNWYSAFLLTSILFRNDWNMAGIFYYKTDIRSL
ncbi:hypothetical protein EWM59_00740 [Emticicia agri]|uniref:AraC-type arabinose-binding/dimerisation domain-containing protein n=1 Tax=Emticicia agri TaxID=2492393 RepID=A0A4Q5M5N1_9BACT|nr:AraC family ligand binding domain-containing protein [Emticicia agri]RYU97682.1 hypothetical protein EWM59_00740 [Emticicia agri]